MGSQVTNLSQNPLLLSDGKMIASGDRRGLDAVSKRERDFEKRGWLQIIEDEPKEAEAIAAPAAAAAAKTEVKSGEGVKK